MPASGGIILGFVAPSMEGVHQRAQADCLGLPGDGGTGIARRRSFVLEKAMLTIVRNRVWSASFI